MSALCQSTAAQNRLSIKRSLYTSFAGASDCQTIAIYEYTHRKRSGCSRPNVVMPLCSCQPGQVCHHVVDWHAQSAHVGATMPETCPTPAPSVQHSNPAQAMTRLPSRIESSEGTSPRRAVLLRDST